MGSRHFRIDPYGIVPVERRRVGVVCWRSMLEPVQAHHLRGRCCAWGGGWGCLWVLGACTSTTPPTTALTASTEPAPSSNASAGRAGASTAVDPIAKLPL